MARRMQVMQKMGIILRWSEQMERQPFGLATAMLEEFPANHCVLVDPAVCGVGPSYASDVDLRFTLAYAWAWTARPEAKRTHLGNVTDLSDADPDHQDCALA